MFKSPTMKLPAWRELFSAMERAEVGTIVTHEDIAKILRMPKGSGRYFGEIQRWRKEEQNVRHRQWVTVRKVGYELQPSNKHRHVATRYVMSAKRAARRGHAVLAHTDLDRLSDYERQQHINAEARSGVLYQIAQATEKEMRHLPAGAPTEKPALTAHVPRPV